MGHSLSKQFNVTAESDSSITVRLRITYTSTGGVSDSSNTLDVNGDWPNKNTSVTISIPYGGGSQVIYDETLTWSKSYGSTTTKDFDASLSGINYWGTTVSTSGDYTADARPYSAPQTPGTPTVTRTSDTKQTVQWARNATTAARIQSQKVQRRHRSGDAWTSYSTIATLTTDYTTDGTNSYVDTTTSSDDAYQYRIVAVNTTAETTGGTSDSAYTTPAPLASIAAAKTASGDIQITMVGGQEVNNTEYVLEHSTDSGSSWSALATVTADRKSTETYTHSSPSTSLPHMYRAACAVDDAGATGDGLTSSYITSNEVTLAAPPDAPTALAATPAPCDLDNDGALSFAWTHNPTDTTPQSAYQIRARVVGETTWVEGTKTPSSDSTADVASFVTALPAVNGDSVEWQVSTWGEATADGRDGTGASEYSATSVVVLTTRPTVAIDSPTAAEVIGLSSVSPSWTFYQAEGATQSSWKAVLKKDGATVETKTAAGTATSTTMATRLLDGGSYTLELSVLSSDGMWSDVDTVAFTVEYLLPADVEVEATWDPSRGEVVFELTAGEAATFAWSSTADASASTRTGAETGVRTNLCRNPLPRTDLTGWYIQSPLVGTLTEDGDGPTGDNWVAVTRDPGTTYAGHVVGGAGLSTSNADLTADTETTVSIWVRPSVELDLTIVFNERDSGASQIVETSGDTTTCPAGVWTRLTMTKTTESTTVYGGPRVAIAETVEWTDLTIGLAAMMVEEASAEGALETYFDGSTPSELAISSVTISRSIDGGTAEDVLYEVPIPAALVPFSVTDYSPSVSGVNEYTVVASSAIPSQKEMDVVTVTTPEVGDPDPSVWLGGGSSFSQVCRGVKNIVITELPGLTTKVVKKYAGRTHGLERSSKTQTHQMYVTFDLVSPTAGELGSDWLDWVALAPLSAPLLFRSREHYLYVSLVSLSARRDPGGAIKGVNLTLEEVDRV